MAPLHRRAGGHDGAGRRPGKPLGSSSPFRSCASSAPLRRVRSSDPDAADRRAGERTVPPTEESRPPRDGVDVGDDRPSLLFVDPTRDRFYSHASLSTRPLDDARSAVLRLAVGLSERFRVSVAQFMGGKRFASVELQGTRFTSIESERRRFSASYAAVVWLGSRPARHEWPSLDGAQVPEVLWLAGATEPPVSEVSAFLSSDGRDVVAPTQAVADGLRSSLPDPLQLRREIRVIADPIPDALVPYDGLTIPGRLAVHLGPSVHVPDFRAALTSAAAYLTPARLVVVNRRDDVAAIDGFESVPCRREAALVREYRSAEAVLDPGPALGGMTVGERWLAFAVGTPVVDLMAAQGQGPVWSTVATWIRDHGELPSVPASKRLGFVAAAWDRRLAELQPTGGEDGGPASDGS